MYCMWKYHTKHIVVRHCQQLELHCSFVNLLIIITNQTWSAVLHQAAWDCSMCSLWNNNSVLSFRWSEVKPCSSAAINSESSNTVTIKWDDKAGKCDYKITDSSSKEVECKFLCSSAALAGPVKSTCLVPPYTAGSATGKVTASLKNIGRYLVEVECDQGSEAMYFDATFSKPFTLCIFSCCHSLSLTCMMLFWINSTGTIWRQTHFRNCFPFKDQCLCVFQFLWTRCAIHMPAWSRRGRGMWVHASSYWTMDGQGLWLTICAYKLHLVAMFLWHC